jgi:ribosomal 50S subunit-associated protein YjgA (DUF615 family)
MDAIAVLTKDHREAEALFARFPSETTEESRKECAQELIAELSKHDAVELEYLYPVLKEVSAQGEQLEEHSLEEHREARELLHKLDTNLSEVMSPSFEADWQRLESMIKEHAQEEVTEAFPLLRAKCSEEQLREMGEKIESSKKTAPTHPHPSTPDNPVGAKVMGTAAAAMDRARDAVQK